MSVHATTAVRLSVDARANAIGREQFGLTTRRQLTDATIGSRTIRRRLADGGWSDRGGGVVDLRTHRPSWEQGLMCALLVVAPRPAWASHTTAASLHGLLDVRRPRRHHVLTRRGVRVQAPEATFHSTRGIGRDEVTRVGPFAITNVQRTLLDLAATWSDDRLEPVIWDAARRTDRLLDRLAGLLVRWPRHPGVTRLRRLLDGIDPQVAAAESPLEVQGLLALRGQRVPPPQLQVTIRDGEGRFVARVDAAWPDAHAIVEFDGRAYHQTPRQQEADTRRRERLRRLGWHVIVLRADDLHGPAFVRTAAALRRRLGVR